MHHSLDSESTGALIPLESIIDALKVQSMPKNGSTALQKNIQICSSGLPDALTRVQETLISQGPAAQFSLQSAHEAVTFRQPAAEGADFKKP